MQHGSSKQKSLIRNAIKQGGLEHIDAITQAIHETGALEYTHEQARAESALAKSAISMLEDNEFKQALLFLADYAVERSH
jgi:octaprenyl-diphosphate synthase